MNYHSHDTLQSLWREIKEAILADRIYEKIQWSLSIFSVIIMPCWIIIILIQSILWEKLGSYILLYVGLGLYLSTFILLTILRKYVINSIDSIVSNNTQLLEIDLHSDRLEETVKWFELNYWNIDTLRIWEDIVYFAIFYRENWWKRIQQKIQEFIEEELKYSIVTLSNLRSDLDTQIQQEQDLLETVKIDLSQKLTDQNKYKSILEYQYQRVVSQIQKFEELEITLNKV